MWAANEASGHAGYGLASETPANFPASSSSSSSGGAASSAAAASGPSSAPSHLSSAMPYPWDHHHLRHHEEVAVSRAVFHRLGLPRRQASQKLRPLLVRRLSFARTSTGPRRRHSERP